MRKSMVYILGIVFLVLIAGYFMLGSTEKASGLNLGKSSGGEMQKVVIGMKNYNYYPNTIRVKAGAPVSIILDSSVVGCFRDFTIREFGIHKYLRTPEETIEFTPAKPGTYTFACSMGMGTGKLIVE